MTLPLFMPATYQSSSLDSISAGPPLSPSSAMASCGCDLGPDSIMSALEDALPGEIDGVELLAKLLVLLPPTFFLALVVVRLSHDAHAHYPDGLSDFIATQIHLPRVVRGERFPGELEDRHVVLEAVLLGNDFAVGVPIRRNGFVLFVPVVNGRHALLLRPAHAVHRGDHEVFIDDGSGAVDVLEEQDEESSETNHTAHNP
eukprot:CAMPEP_0194347968 /NCGR_PEP_ID=MMETSP0171-20130528/106281_1 /TAXON_ID=218684 /ORGANISM="Corethron pennatum, Strain L29A3" /LENGTH=200 /DNA_ID=CAMNT_0039115273 /DNA_START=824 /DNA_END=1421 /DNA_ORIENTATION=+